MKKQRFTEPQIASILKHYEGGREAMDLCRECLHIPFFKYYLDFHIGFYYPLFLIEFQNF